MLRREPWQDVVQDVRLALRHARRAPGFFAAMVLSLAIGIGANTAVFSILQSTLLQPLPYREPGRLAMIWNSSRRFPTDRGVLTPPSVLVWHDELTKELGDIAAVLSWQGNTEGAVDFVRDQGAERLNGAFVTPNFFDILGVRAAAGRLFTAADEASADPLIVLSYALWQRDFGGDRSIIGRPLTLTAGRADRVPKRYVVAGVLPRAVHFTYPVETEVWIMAPWSSVRAYPAVGVAYQGVTRMASGVTIERLARRLETYRAGLDFPEFHFTDADAIIRPQLMREWILGDVRPSLQLMAVVAVLLFIVTCVTIANGMLARVSQRQQELAVRAAIGASRWRLTRQLVAEGGVLAVCGAVSGVVAVAAAHPVLRYLLPASVPQVGDLADGARLMVFAGLAATLVILVAALVPAIIGAVSQTPAALVRASSSASTGRAALRLRHGLVGVQAALATALLVCATLLMASFWRLGHVPLGFDGERVVTVEMRLLGPTVSRASLDAFRRELTDNVRAIPGVVDVGLTTAVPFRGVDFMSSLAVPGQTHGLVANRRSVDAGFFRVLRLPLVRGRYLTETDDGRDGHVTVISQSLARTLFGDKDPIGQRIPLKQPLEVVGVVADARYVPVGSDQKPAFYVSFEESPSELLCIVARASLPLEQIAPAIREVVHRIDPTVPVMRATTIDRIVDQSVAGRRFYTVMTGAFAAIAIVLTLGGLIAVVARVVAERRRELAIRLALGASAMEVARNASLRSLSAAGIGVLLGLAFAYALAAGLAQFLYAVDARSAPAYVAVGGAMLVVAVVATWHPVRRLHQLPLIALLKAE
jgi:predicted permease